MATHELPATSEHFCKNTTQRDGLSARCRVCVSAYSKARTAAKKAGGTFSARPQQVSHPDGTPVFMATAVQRAEREAATEPPTATYHDALALEAEQGRAKGYTSELVAGVVYALPTDAATQGSPEGQAALGVANAARDAERRRRDAERKRAERAAKKAAATA
jgi:hypothetical protein